MRASCAAEVRSARGLIGGLEGLAFFDAEGGELVDHDAVAVDPVFGLDDGVEVIEEGGVVLDGGVEVDVFDVGEGGAGRVRGGGVRVDAHLFAVGDGGGDVGGGVALEVGAEEHVTAEGVGLQREEAGGDLLFVAGRKDDELTAFAFVDAHEAGVFEGHLPDGDDVGVEGAGGSGGGEVEDDGAVPGVEEDHVVEGIGVGREGLIFRVERAAPVDDLADLAGSFGEHLLQHEVVVHGGHAPDDGFDGAGVEEAVVGVLRGRC